MKKISQCLGIGIVGLLMLSLPKLSAAQTDGVENAKADTTIILRKLGRWDNDSAMDTREQTFNDLWGWESEDGREYAIMGGLANTYFIDITNPQEPELVAKKPGRGTQGIHRDYATYQHYCYAVTDEFPGALRIYDLQYLPDSVPLVYDTIEHAGRVHNIFQDNGRLYLSSNSLLTERYPMTVLGIDEPTSPELLGHLQPDSMDLPVSITGVHDTYVRNDTVFASGEYRGLFILDYSDPQDPSLISAIQDYPFQGYNHSSWVTDDGRTLVMADETHGKPLKVFDISDLSNPQYLAPMGVSTDVGSIPHNPLIKDGLAFVSYYHEGLQVFDVANPQRPVKIDSDDTYPQYPKDTIEGFEGCWGVYPFFSSGVVAASDQTNGLFLYKVDTVVTEPNNVFDLTAATTFHNQIQVQVEAYEPVDVQVSLYSLHGKPIHQKAQPILRSGEHLLEFSQLGGLSPGLYLLHARGSGDQELKRMVKVR